MIDRARVGAGVLILLAVFIFLGIASAILGCSDKNPIGGYSSDNVEDARFIMNDGEAVYSLDHYTILTDTETGVQYLIIQMTANPNSSIMTPLLNPDGTPMVTVE